MDARPVLITGARGFVGARAMEMIPNAVACPSALLREGNAEHIAAYVQELAPATIIHTAAISDIGDCERDPEGSRRANVELTVAMARAARAAGAKLVAFSSDQVYTGCAEDGPYSEQLRLPEPANVYARHKLESEARSLDIWPESVLLRAEWMYDMPLYGHKNRGNFLVNTLRAVQTGGKIACSEHVHRGITYVRQVVELLPQAAGLPGGVYNYGSENELTMPQTARALLEALRLGELADRLIEIRPERQHSLWLDCSALRRHGIAFDTTAEGFARCARDYGLSG